MGVQAATGAAQAQFAAAEGWGEGAGGSSKPHCAPCQLHVLPCPVTLSKLRVLPKPRCASRSKYEVAPTSEPHFEGCVIIQGAQRMSISVNSLLFILSLLKPRTREGRTLLGRSENERTECDCESVFLFPACE